MVSVKARNRSFNSPALMDLWWSRPATCGQLVGGGEGGQKKRGDQQMLTTSITNYTHIPETPNPWFCSRNFKFNRPLRYSGAADGIPRLPGICRIAFSPGSITLMVQPGCAGLRPACPRSKRWLTLEMRLPGQRTNNFAKNFNLLSQIVLRCSNICPDIKETCRLCNVDTCLTYSHCPLPRLP